MLIVKVLRNRNFILVSAVVLGLLIGKSVATFTEPLVLPGLAVVMTLSTASITSRDFATSRTRIKLILVALIINYLITGGVILLMGKWLLQDSELWTGLVVIAAVPPGVAAVPWSHILGGDILLSLAGVLVLYLLALVLTPAIIILFLGVDFFSPFNLLILLGELIVIPLMASRILLVTGLAKRIDRWRGTITNWSFFIVLFTIIGLNRAAFFTEYDILVKLGITALIASFGLSYVIELVAKFFGLKQPSIISLILVGTMKNFGLASGILLTLFSERYTIPASIMIVFFLSRTIWLSFHFRRES
jgi:BASS family bile acid:Na+ symporter